MSAHHSGKIEQIQSGKSRMTAVDYHKVFITRLRQLSLFVSAHIRYDDQKL